MPLKRLVQKDAADRNLDLYPNHNNPPQNGGFNYGFSSTPIFDGTFRQRTFKFGEGTANDRPFWDGDGFSREPFIGKNFELPSANEDDHNARFVEFADTITDGLIRGGILTAASRTAKDVVRYGKFLISQRGIGWILANVGLQRSNPVIRKAEVDTSSTEDFFESIGEGISNLGGSNSNQRVFNLGLNVGTSIAGSAFGLHIKREGLLPTAYEGYVDDINKAQVNPYHSDYKPDLLTADPLKGNRLINLFGSHYLSMMAAPSIRTEAVENERVVLGATEDGNRVVSDLTRPSIDIPSVGGVNDLMVGGDFASVGDAQSGFGEFLSGGNDLGRKELYSYSGGPNSLYGLTRTTIMKAGTNFNTTGRIEMGGKEFILADSTPFLNSKTGYLSPANWVTTTEQSHIETRTYDPWEDEQLTYEEAEEAEEIDYDVTVIDREEQRSGNTVGGVYIHPIFKPNNNKLSELKSNELLIGGKIPRLFSTGFPDGVGKYAPEHPNKLRRYSDDDGSDKFINPKIRLSHIGDFRHKKRDGSQKWDRNRMSGNTEHNGYPRFADVGKYGMKTSTSNANRFYREERVNLGNPGQNLVKKPGDIWSYNTLGDTTYSYDLYNEETIDKINALDIFRNEKNKDTFGQQGRDLIKFRIEALDGGAPTKSDVMIFRANLEEFQDDYTAEWSDYQYNGRAEKFYTYGGFDRSIAFSFKIAAQSRHEMMPIYRKLNYLVSQTAPEYANSRMRAPYCRLTIGNMIDRTPGFFTQIGLSWSTEYPWEITINEPEGGEDADGILQLPHILDVKCSYKPVHLFAPQKGIRSTFILPREDGPYTAQQIWTKHAAASSHKNADIMNQREKQLKKKINLPLTN